MPPQSLGERNLSTPEPCFEHAPKADAPRGPPTRRVDGGRTVSARPENKPQCEAATGPGVSSRPSHARQPCQRRSRLRTRPHVGCGCGCGCSGGGGEGRGTRIGAPLVNPARGAGKPRRTQRPRAAAGGRGCAPSSAPLMGGVCGAPCARGRLPSVARRFQVERAPTSDAQTAERPPARRLQLSGFLRSCKRTPLRSNAVVVSRSPTGISTTCALPEVIISLRVGLHDAQHSAAAT